MTIGQMVFFMTFLNSFLPEKEGEILKQKRKNVAFLHALSLSLLLL
jgi:hypothetical protein